MAEIQSSPRLVRFGAFEADVQSGELRKDGVKLRFSGQPFQVLAILLERRGEVVTREELQKRLWPDTFVDVERNLNTAINKIREVLGDSAESPRFVETLPRRGYRFIGELEAPIRPVDPVITVEPVRALHRRQGWLKFGAGVLAISVIALTTLVAYRWHRQPRPPEQAVLTAVPFTALPGFASSPAFSPDGSRIAFAWSPAPGTNGFDFDLYVKALGSETLLRLTQHPSTGLSPAWSPDGTQIAFYKRAGADSGIYLVPALGGPEQKLRSTRELWNAISWSPDGKWIAFTDVAPEENRKRIYLLSTETLATRRIPMNSTCFSEDLPAFSHNGEYLAYGCYRPGDDAAIYSFSLPDGKPKMIGPFLAEPSGLTWSADDTRLILSSWKGQSSPEIGEVLVANGSAKRLGLEGNGAAVSPKGDKLAYASKSNIANLWRRDLLHPEAPAVELIPSSRSQFEAQYSPDGKRIAFSSLRSGLQSVWISNEDETNLIQISDANSMSGSPQWSPDGNNIAFDSYSRDSWDIYVAEVAKGKPRKLVTNISPIIRPNWSRDGRWIYFVSQEPGREGIYRCPDSGGDATLLSKDTHGVNLQESLDGKTLYFLSRMGEATLKKVALPGQPGAESEVDRSLRGGPWTVSPGGIYFVPDDAPGAVRYFDFASKRVRTIFAMDGYFNWGLSVSPDGRWILYSHGDATGDIMLVDHFH